ncbi:MAG TPA: (2Fe-2S)-binding protein [Azospirillum sp.]|nr:(2Fe-2S)-binding protein [Azospirillum sp.]
MFRKLPDPTSGGTVTVTVAGRAVAMAAGDTAAAAVLAAGLSHCRTTPASGAPRAPYCMMGVCFECLMVIDGVPSRQGCQTPVREGMRIDPQHGGRELLP